MTLGVIERGSGAVRTGVRAARRRLVVSRRMRSSDMLRRMAEGKVMDAAQQLAELRERVRVLEERVDTFGRHL